MLFRSGDWGGTLKNLQGSKKSGRCLYLIETAFLSDYSHFSKYEERCPRQTAERILHLCSSNRKVSITTVPWEMATINLAILPTAPSFLQFLLHSWYNFCSFGVLACWHGSVLQTLQPVPARQEDIPLIQKFGGNALHFFTLQNTNLLKIPRKKALGNLNITSSILRHKTK